jgi:hypothetical protein
MSKIFNNANISTKKLRALCNSFVKQQGVKRTVFNNRGKFVKGTYNCFNKTMYINTEQTKIELMHALFHELGHHEAVKNEKWLDYHFNSTLKLTNEEVFEIENGVDKIAEKLWAKYVDCSVWGRYKYAYPKSKRTRIINEFINVYSNK